MRLMNKCILGLTAINLRCLSLDALTLVSRSAASLSSLRLVDIAPVLAWDVMDMLRGSSGVQQQQQQQQRFARLTMLALSFSDTSTSPTTITTMPAVAAEPYPTTTPLSPPSHSGSSSSPSFFFPALQSLSVRHCPFDVRLCLAVVVPPALSAARTKSTAYKSRRCLAQFEIHGSKLDVLDLAMADSGACDSLSSARSVTLACVGMTRHSVDRVERFVSNALGTCAAAESLSLTAISSRAIVNIDSVLSTVCGGGGGGAHLRALELRVPLCLAIAEALLPQLPHLRRLCLPYVATELSLLPPLPTKSSRVFSRSLQFLSMGFWDCRQDLCAMSRAVVGFVSAIPSLLTLVHDAHVAADVRRLIACNTTTTATTTAAADHLHKLMITDHTKLFY